MDGTEHDRQVGEAITNAITAGARVEGDPYQVFVLTAAEAPDTIRLVNVITNNSVGAGGKPSAWTQGQRYTSVSRLTKANITQTSDL